MRHEGETSGGAAAARRARAAAVRVAEVQDRARRLDEGVPSTDEDVRRARQQAVRQGQACAGAQEDLAAAHRSAEHRHTDVARVLDAADRPEQAQRHRRAAELGRDRVFAPDGEAPVDKAGPAQDGEVHDELARLRSAMVAGFSWAGREGSADDPLRVHLARAVVSRSGSPRWRGWSHAVCVVAVDETPGVRGAAVTRFSPAGAPELWAASSPWAWRVEEAQHLVGDGPSLTAFRTRAVVDARRPGGAESPWPGLALALPDGDIEAVSVHPLAVRGAVVGTISIYGGAGPAGPVAGLQGRASTSGPSTDAAPAGTVLADIAAVALLADVDGEAEGPSGVGSLVVHVAAGLLASRLGVKPVEAATLMRAAAFSREWTLARLARAVVYGGLDLR